MGLDGKNVSKALQLILKECRKIAQKGPTLDELLRARDYSIGSSRIALERASTQNHRLGTSLLIYDKVFTPEYLYDRLAKVTQAEIQTAAKMILQNQNLCLAMVGNGPDREELLSVIRSS